MDLLFLAFSPPDIKFMYEPSFFKSKGLYKLAKSNYRGFCSYCGKALAGEMRLMGWDICKQCDTEIMDGKREATIIPEN